MISARAFVLTAIILLFGPVLWASDKDADELLKDARAALGKDPNRNRAKAERLLRDALAIADPALSPEQAADANVLLCLVLMGQGTAPATVRPFAEEAIRRYESTKPVNLSRLALALECLARSAEASDDLAAATAARKRSTEIRTHILFVKQGFHPANVGSGPDSVEMPPAPGSSGPDTVSSPIPENKVEPQYSFEARIAKWDGKVLLAIVIDPEGRPRNITLRKSVGFGLDEKALEAILQWRFKPAKKENNAVPVSANVELAFRLL